MSTRAWSQAGWGVLVVVAAFGWFATGRGLAFRLGLGEGATGLGLALAAAVCVTLVNWARTDLEARALAHLECPRCHSALITWHAHATQMTRGRQVWRCDSCGHEQMRALTCEGCAA